MSRQRYSPEFKEEAVRQVIQQGYSIRAVAERIGVSAHSLYKWARAARPVRADADGLTATKPANAPPPSAVASGSK